MRIMYIMLTNVHGIRFWGDRKTGVVQTYSMGRRIRLHRALGPELIRLYNVHVDRALTELQRPGRAPGENAVHQARRAIKRARATLRLVRPALRARDFQACDDSLRRAARCLSEARDRTVLVTTLARLAAGARADLSDVEQALVGSGKSAPRRLADDDLAHAIQLLGTARRGLSRPKPLAAPDVAGAAARTYRKARKAFHAAVGPGASGAVFHRLRRHAKYHAIHVHMLRDVWPEVFKAWAARLDELADLLGDEHDLTVLCERVELSSPALPGPAIDTVRSLARDAQADLRARALRVAGVLFAERAGALEARIAAYCVAARSG